MTALHDWDLDSRWRILTYSLRIPRVAVWYRPTTSSNCGGYSQAQLCCRQWTEPFVQSNPRAFGWNTFPESTAVIFTRFFFMVGKENVWKAAQIPFLIEVSKHRVVSGHRSYDRRARTLANYHARTNECLSVITEALGTGFSEGVAL